jgi:SAM-dependent methyltransferase
MPTIVPEPARESHQLRAVAESFGSDAQRYDRSRPHYPDALVQRIVDSSPGRDVLDVGCGTGISARQLRAAGATVLGVDVDERMAEVARRSGLTVEVAAFEAWDPAGRTFDAVTAGQTWHWVDPLVGAEKAAAVLRPGGRLAVFWNVAQPPPEVGEAFAEIYARVLPQLPAGGVKSAMDAYAVMLAKAADGMRAAGAFGTPEEWRFEWERPYTRDEWLDQIPSHGGMSLVPPAKLAELLAAFGAAIDAVGGAFTMHFTAVAVTATRTGTP